MTSLEPDVTIVSRETSGFSVGATLSDSMLYPRDENMEVTRVSAPASFCKRIEMICRMTVNNLTAVTAGV